MVVSNTSRESIRRRTEKLPFSSLNSKGYDVVQFYVGHEEIQSALSFDNSATIELAKNLPLGLRGDQHRKIRSAMALALANGKKRLHAELPDLIEKHFSLLKSAGSHDLLNELCKPFAGECMALLSGIFLEADQSDHLSDIFDPGASIRRRRALEEVARDLLRSDGDTNMQISVATSAMGRDPLLGTLVYCLHDHFLSVLNQPMNSRSFDAVPTQTAVPYVWREKTSGDPVGSLSECRLDQFHGQQANERLNYFGGGRHSCLGKPHTLLIFNQLSQFLSTCDRVVLDSQVSSIDCHVLRLPNKFTVKLG